MKPYSKKTTVFMCLAITLTGLIFSGCGKSKSDSGPVVSQKVWYKDADGDGFGDKANTINSDTQPSGYVDNALDCNDNDAKVNPMLGNCPGYEIKAGIIPDTGQTISYTTTFGEDSDYLINPPSYTKLDQNGNTLPDNAATWSMIKDNVTGLIWEIKDNPDNKSNANDIHDADNTYTWDEAGTTFIKALNDSNFGNFSDGLQWRLPTVRELSLLVNSSMYNPVINPNYFPSKSYALWTATPSVASSANAFCFATLDGTYLELSKTTKYWTWAVRGQQTDSTFVDMGSGIIQDTATGLMWQQATSTNTDGKGYSFDDALTYCNTLSLGGFRDWRLPSRNELITLLQFDKQNPSVQSDLFTDISTLNYWTSTTLYFPSSNSGGMINLDDHPYTGWAINLYSHSISFQSKTNLYAVKAVRGGKNLNLRTWYKDADGDGYGDPAISIVISASLPQPAGYVSNNTDCNDMDKTINPAATEIPNDGIDQNCDGKDLVSWYRDTDGDGYGNPTDTVLSETQPTGYVRNSLDCNDLNISINPGMADLLGDGLDNNCDGKPNVFWYKDEDGDGYGAGEVVGRGEDTPNLPNYVQPYANNNLDCKDDDPNIHPGLVGAAGCYDSVDITNQKNVPDTGQTKTYTGIGNEDGDTLINPPSYTANIGYIQDNVTGLNWELKTDTNSYTYSAAQAYVSNLASSNYAGKNDWRLPTAGELAMIASLDKSNPAINTDFFKNIASDKYWTSTDTDATHQLAISFRYGESYAVLATDATVHVMAVRGRKEANVKDLLIDNNNNTITQRNTRLMWNVNEYDAHNWKESYTYWTGLTSSGHSDWRLPTADEVESLISLIEENNDLNIKNFISGVEPGLSLWSYTLSNTSETKAMIYCLKLSDTSRETSTNYVDITTTLKSLGVRGTMLPRFIDNGDGTVLDSKTGLMWMQPDANGSTKMTFIDALTYCKNTLNVTGFPALNTNKPGSQTYKDWRIPNRNELLSLLDAAANNWDAYHKAFPNSGALYWTSSSVSDSTLTDNAWQIDFTVNAWSICIGGYTTQSNVFRAVRGGTP